MSVALKNQTERDSGCPEKGEEENMVITKYSLIGAILQYHPTAKECFEQMGMHCVGCHLSPRETLEQACITHNMDVEELIQKLDMHINGK